MFFSTAILLIISNITKKFPDILLLSCSISINDDNMRKIFIYVIPLFLLLFSCIRNKPQQSDITIVKGGIIIDLSGNGKTGKDIKEGYIIYSGDSILEVGRLSDRNKFPTGAKVIDASGKYIMPGLIDGFAVMNNQAYANAFLYSGITTIIGVEGGRRGPFFYFADPSPDFYMLESVGDFPKPDSSQLFDLRKLYEEKYKIALLKYELRSEQVKLLVDSARRFNMGTIGELGFTSYQQGCEYGVDAFVHTTRYSLDVAPPEMRKAVAAHPFSDDLNSPKWKYYRYLYSLDTSDKALKEHAKILASSHSYLMPTMSLLYADLPGSSNPWLKPVAGIIKAKYINNPVDKSTGKHDYSEDVQKNYTAMARQELKIESVYRKAGCRYLAGSATDVWGTMPGISLHTELELLHRIGLSNREVLAAATTNFADAFRWKTGSIEKGFEPDILILDKNPLENLENTWKISILISNGKIINREKLLKGKTDYSDDPDGMIISRQPMDIFADTAVVNAVETKVAGERMLKSGFKYLDKVITEELYYVSDGLKVKAYLAYPNDRKKHPAIIYNRGGNREFAKLNPKKMAKLLARVASWGYVVIGSQYRGNDGGEGKEEFGGADVDDVLNLIPLLESLPNVDTSKIGIYGRSRGGMMTYLAMMHTCRFKAAVVVGGAADLRMMNENRGNEMEAWVYSELMPDYWEYKDSLLSVRSAITRVNEICKTTPVLLLHGTADWRVMPEESLNMALAFQKEKVPYRLVMFEGGDHGLTEFKKEQYEMIKKWFDKYLKNSKKLPVLKPHGD